MYRAKHLIHWRGASQEIFIYMDRQEKLHNLRHSLAHILASAVLEMFPKAQLGVGPVIEHGFFYDFLLPRPLTPDDIKVLEKRMRSLAQEKLAFERMEMTTQEAKKFFANMNQPFKVELIGDIEKFGTTKADEILNQEHTLSPTPTTPSAFGGHPSLAGGEAPRLSADRGGASPPDKGEYYPKGGRGLE